MTVGVNDGARIGIVGRNGDGKSSLLGMLTGRIAPHAGRVTLRGGLRVTALDQADTMPPDAAVGQLLVGDLPEHEWAGNPRIRDVVAGLVSDIDWQSPVARLSGGQRRRVQLAELLIGDWDVIGLDEPTNHLDIEGITWLAEHLKTRWPRTTGGLLIVTHDRWFLDEVANTTWEVHDGVVEPFDGGYAAYVLQRVERDRVAAAAEAKRQNLMRKELAWLRRGAPARTSKPKFRIDAANQLIEDVPPIRNGVELAKLATARLGKDVIDLLDVSVSYDGKPVLRDVEWRIGPGERTGIVGANGAGKVDAAGVDRCDGGARFGPGQARQDGAAGDARSAIQSAHRYRRRYGPRSRRPAPARLYGRGQGAYSHTVVGALGFSPRPVVVAGGRTFRRAAPAAAADADAARGAQRAGARRTDERRRHRYALGH